MENVTKNKTYDCFISHASEDKENFVRELAESLRAKGLNVWYDEYKLTIGDSLRESIDKGLKDSICGLVVLSKNFFAKNWTDYELNGLIAKQNSNGQKIILPIWHNISRDEVIEYSPSLADLVSANSKSNIETLTREICKKIQKIKNSNLNVETEETIITSFEETIEKYENEIKEEKTEQELLNLLERFIVDKKYRIKLHKLINAETEKLIIVLKNDFENLAKNQPSAELIYSKMMIYDTYCERILTLLINGLYWDEDNDELWLNPFKKIFNSRILTTGHISIINLQLYPALIIYYSLLIVCLLKSKYSLIAKLMSCICYSKNNSDENTALSLLHPFNIISKEILNNKLGEQFYTPLSDHIHDVLKPYFEKFVYIDPEYSDLFDLVEYFIHLQYGAIKLEKEKRFWAPVGRFKWRAYKHLTDMNYDLVPKKTMQNQIKTNKKIFSCNLLGGNIEKFSELIKISDEFLSEIHWH